MVTYKLYLIRHGMTKGNLEGRFVGRTDLPLCEEGIAELKKLQEEYEYPDVQKVYSSPMARCVETADILYPNRLLQRVDNLREYDFGVFEGQLAKDLAGTEMFVRWNESGMSAAPEGAESITDFAQRVAEKGKRADNVRRAKTMFLDIGQSNSWDYMGTFTSACADPSSDIRAIPKWINNWNTNHHAKIRYLMIFELGEKGSRLHAHVLLKDVPSEFVREYTSAEYSKLPRDVKRLYAQYMTEKGTRLATCPWWSFGWSTLVPVDGSPKVVSYMSKYMTKQNLALTTRFGGQSFLVSKGLNRPQKQKVPVDIAATMWDRVPSGSWCSSFRGDDGFLLSSCFIMDKDKLSPDLWEYYSQIFNNLQSGF